MKKQEKNGKRSASVFGRFCSAIALCTIIVTLAATALPIIALSVRRISDRPAAGAADESSNIYSAERDGYRLFKHGEQKRQQSEYSGSDNGTH